MSTRELQLEPKCPDCGRLTVDNQQHCAEKPTDLWRKCCQWMKCVGLVQRADGTKVRCGRVYGRPGWPGFKGGSS